MILAIIIVGLIGLVEPPCEVIRIRLKILSSNSCCKSLRPKNHLAFKFLNFYGDKMIPAGPDKTQLIVATPGALEAMEAASVTAAELIVKHRACSDIDADYHLCHFELPKLGEKVVVLSEDGETTIMLLEEY